MAKEGTFVPNQQSFLNASGIRDMFEWWTDLPWWLRYGVAFSLLGASTFLYFKGTWWPWGWGMGAALLLFSGPSDSEKKGYHF